MFLTFVTVISLKFVMEFVGTPHPRIFIINEILCKILTNNSMKKKTIVRNTPYGINKQVCMHKIKSINKQIKAPLL